MTYLILSLKWSPSRSGYAVWWGPGNTGYTEDIKQAGRYTQAQVDSEASYYNNNHSTLAVPEDEVLNKASNAILGELSSFWVAQEGQRLVRGHGVVSDEKRTA